MKNRIPKLEEMTLREKIYQTIVFKMEKGKPVNIAPGAAFFFGQIITEADEAGLDELRGYVKELAEKCEIPPLITSDFENGCGSMVKALTPLPFMMGLGATDNAETAYNYGKVTALEARTIGANWTFSPVSDLNRNRRNPLVNNRGMTDDTELAVKMIPQIIKGMQDHELSACAKHFPGDGMDYRDQHITTTYNDCEMDDWRATYGRVFAECIATGVDSIMAGHIGLPDYPQKLSERFDMPLPATLSKELITDLLKGEMGFEGIVVTDAIGMGGFAGWYPTQEITEIESFKAGCDMMLWPSDSYADNLEKAILSGEVPMERLDDAVTRILRVKEKRGLFEEGRELFRELSEEEKQFIKDFQQKCAEQSITLLRNDIGHLPLDPQKTPRIGIIAVAEYAPALAEARLLKEEFEKRGFTVEYTEEGRAPTEERLRFYRENDLVLYATFSRAFRPIGFLDYTDGRASRISRALLPPYAVEKLMVVSFGSPYFGDQYFEKVQTYVNAYSMLACSVKAFVRAACGEIEFQGKSPVKLFDRKRYLKKLNEKKEGN
ncbi:MAG: glycoside hydrolase family 3 protein [Clostridia bacterium]|nr:glycoside hydrolase family 3 protein [Clostridia bacterium]